MAPSSILLPVTLEHFVDAGSAHDGSPSPGRDRARALQIKVRTGPPPRLDEKPDPGQPGAVPRRQARRGQVGGKGARESAGQPAEQKGRVAVTRCRTRGPSGEKPGRWDEPSGRARG